MKDLPNLFFVGDLGKLNDFPLLAPLGVTFFLNPGGVIFN